MARLISIMLVVFLFALGASTLPASATDCMSAVSGLLQCRDYLASPGLVAPGAQCCAGVRNLVIGNGQEMDGVCKCLRQNPLGSAYLLSKALLLPSLCNLGSSLVFVNCRALSEKTFIPFLPPFNIPALAPYFAPFIPRSPFPPLTPNTPLPPLTPNTPPSANQPPAKEVSEKTFIPFLPPFNIPALAPYFSPFIPRSPLPPLTPNTPLQPLTPNSPPSENQPLAKEVSEKTFIPFLPPFNIPALAPFFSPFIPGIPHPPVTPNTPLPPLIPGIPIPPSTPDTPLPPSTPDTPLPPSTPNTPLPPLVATPPSPLVATPPSEDQPPVKEALEQQTDGGVSTNTFNIPLPPWVPNPFLQPEIPNIPIPAPPAA